VTASYARPQVALLVGLLLMLAATGCGGVVADAPTQVNIRFAPPAPLHVEFVMTATVTVSGPAFAHVPPDKRRILLTQRLGLDIARAADEDAYSLRISVNDKTAPYTVRVSSRTAEIVRVIPDPGAATAPELPDPSAFLTGVSNDLVGPWRIGDSRITALRVPVVEGTDVSGSATTTVTLRRCSPITRLTQPRSGARKTCRRPVGCSGGPGL
jgi:hypothetical protein